MFKVYPSQRYNIYDMNMTLRYDTTQLTFSAAVCVQSWTSPRWGRGSSRASAAGCRAGCGPGAGSPAEDSEK